MATISTLSRRASEFAGVALFAAALIWLIALVTHEQSDPVWFFTAGDAHSAGSVMGTVTGSVVDDVASLPVMTIRYSRWPSVRVGRGRCATHSPSPEDVILTAYQPPSDAVRNCSSAAAAVEPASARAPMRA